MCRNLWKVFGDGGTDLVGSVDPSISREEVLAQTGCVLAVRDVSFDVREGETFVIMGPFRQRQVNTRPLPWPAHRTLRAGKFK